jgi:anti-sigma B factor antagonist
MALEIETKQHDTTSLISARGEVDLYTSPQLRDAIMDAVPSAKSSAVAVDLSGVRYMDSSGVATLVEGLRRSRDQNKGFKLVAPSTAVMKVLELAKLDSVFEVSSEP